MKSIISIVLAVFLLAGFAGNAYSASPVPTRSPAAREAKQQLSDKPSPLAPLVLPKRDYWVGTIEIKRTRDIHHHREGKANINHAFMKGDGYFTEYDDYHESYTATITIEPCPVDAHCTTKANGKVVYTLENHQNMQRTQPRNCRGGGMSLISDASSEHRSESANGPAEQTRVNVGVRDDDKQWHLQVFVHTGLKVKGVTVESKVVDMGCGGKPVHETPASRPDSRDLGSQEESFSTGIADRAALRLDAKKTIEHVIEPDPAGTSVTDHTVTYHLRRVQEY
jgi:hypothetical protein